MSTNIFLDKISTTAHMKRDSELESEPWRQVLVQPITVPNLAHTGIRSSFTFSGMSTLRPDGTVSNACKRHIRREFRELPKQTVAYDPLDMSRRDKDKRLRKAQRIYKVKATREAEMLRRSSMLVQTGGVDGGNVGFDDSLDGLEDEGSVSSMASYVEPELNQTQQTAASHVIQHRSTGVQENERLKKPFSEASLFTALLESQVGGSGKDRWDLDEMM
ncbi:hypothetical protein TrLO_g1454 [Triparma laevis f. longispina]|uniref:Uncharacterized protein n=1 Tax=Triparma laevis f. longispina TaxID=1714387 RepID=A0A9W7EJ19_9STRA|nr:hypothetical protein TrLO_g1454 [Triparma laevis f. longispina]